MAIWINITPEIEWHAILNGLGYSTEDKRRSRPNPSKIPIEGDIRSNLGSYRDALKRYRKFRDSLDRTAEAPPLPDNQAYEVSPGSEEIG